MRSGIGSRVQRLRSALSAAAVALMVVGIGTFAGCGGGGGGSSGGGGGTFTGNISASKSTVAAATASTTAPADGTTGIPITVTINDANGKPIANAVVVAAASGADTFITYSGITNSQGVVTITVTSTKAQTETITVTAYQNGVQVGTPLTQTVSVTFTQIPVGSTGSTISASPTSLTADGSSTSTISVTVVDTNGAAVSNANVTFTATGTSVTVNPTTPVATSASGAASCTISSTVAQTGVTVSAAISFPGSSSATAATLTSQPISFVAGSPVGLSIPATTASAGQPFTLTVNIVDANGNICTTATREIGLCLPGNVTNTKYGKPNYPAVWNSCPTFQPNIPQPQATMNNVVVAQNGVATFPAIFVNKSGSWTFGAIASGLPSATGTVTVTAGLAKSLTFATQLVNGPNGATDLVAPAATVLNTKSAPSSITDGSTTASTFAPTILVQAVDAYGNPTGTLPAGTHPVQLSGTGIALAGNGTAAGATTFVNLDANGQALFPGITTTTATANALVTITATDMANGSGGTSLTTLPAVSTGAGAAVIEVVPAGDCTAVNVTGFPTTLTAGTASAGFTVNLVDQTNTAAAARTTVTVTFYLISASGLIVTPSAINGVAGNTLTIANPNTNATGVTLTIGNYSSAGSGPYTLLVTAQDKDTIPNTYSLVGSYVTGVTIKPGVAASMAFTQVPGFNLSKGVTFPNAGICTVAGGTLTLNQATNVTPNLQLTMYDANNNPTNLPSAAAAGNTKVTLTLTANAAGVGTINGVTATSSGPTVSTLTGDFAGGSSVTFGAIQIKATAASNAPTVPDKYTFSAALAGDATVKTTAGPSVTVIANGTAAGCAFVNGYGPASTVAGDDIESANGHNEIQVQLQDAFGVPVLTSGTTITMGGYNAQVLGYYGIGVGVFGSSYNGGIAVGNAGTTDANGIAHYNKVTENSAGVNFHLVAGSATLNPALTGGFDILAGPVAGSQFLWNINTGVVVTSGAQISPAASGPQGIPVVALRDSFGNFSMFSGGTATVSFPFGFTPTAANYTAGGLPVLHNTTVSFVNGIAVFNGLNLTQTLSGAVPTVTYPLIIEATGVPGSAGFPLTPNTVTVR